MRFHALFLAVPAWLCFLTIMIVIENYQAVIASLLAASPGVMLYFDGVIKWKSWLWFMDT